MDLMATAEKRHARTALSVATANDAVRLKTSTAERKAAWGAINEPLQLARLTVTRAVSRINIATPQP